MSESGHDHDFLSISTSDSGVIRKLSGDSKIHHEPVITSDRTVELEFITDSFIHYRGFLLKYQGQNVISIIPIKGRLPLRSLLILWASFILRSEPSLAADKSARKIVHNDSALANNFGRFHWSTKNDCDWLMGSPLFRTKICKTYSMYLPG